MACVDYLARQIISVLKFCIKLNARFMNKFFGKVNRKFFWQLFLFYSNAIQH